RVSDGGVAWGYGSSSFAAGQAYANGVVYVTSQSRGSQPATLIALRATDGKQLWSVGLDLPGVWPPVSANGTVYVSDDDGPAGQNPRPGLVYAIRVTDGSVLWKHERPDGIVTMPAVG
ncbi:MAG TPA: PQQ-binding-like beta-propeller repeat protein, partial [Ktedonobacterales bacterium]|nr:PQQ-binding-like beta-propeller repeat protein [Ktedonobacterales bacterium]